MSTADFHHLALSFFWEAESEDWVFYFHSLDKQKKLRESEHRRVEKSLSCVIITSISNVYLLPDGF